MAAEIFIDPFEEAAEMMKKERQTRENGLNPIEGTILLFYD